MYSCGEKLMEKPEDLIPKEKMINILKDFTILNSAKNTSAIVLQDHNIEATEFIFSKYGIDSLQFVTSDKYYASLPNEYEAIYIEIEKRISVQKDQMSEAKRLKDSMELRDKLRESPLKKAKSKKPKNNLP